jgi:hypothetical protein
MFNMLSALALAPMQRWSQTPVMHKLIMAGAGAGVAYYLHKRGLTDATVAVGGIGAAYGASMLMHAPAIVGAPMQSNGAPVLALPPAQVNGMIERAQAALSQGQASVPASNVNTVSQSTAAPLAAAPSPPPDPSSPWAGLG